MFAYRNANVVCRFLNKISRPSNASRTVAFFQRGHGVTGILNVGRNRLVTPTIFNTVSIQRFAAKSESTLVDFLKEEIEAEKHLGQKQFTGAKQPNVPGFQVKTENSQVTLTKQHGSETITVTFDVNHTVDTDPNTEAEAKTPQTDAGDGPQMVSKPNFTVEIKKGEQKLAFECSFIEPNYEDDAQQQQEDYADHFNIEEIYMFKGDIKNNENCYAVSGGIIDGTLYDHLMNYLEERGIDNEFAQNVSQFATHYEHSQYVGLLQKLRDFVSN